MRTFFKGVTHIRVVFQLLCFLQSPPLGHFIYWRHWDPSTLLRVTLESLFGLFSSWPKLMPTHRKEGHCICLLRSPGETYDHSLLSITTLSKSILSFKSIFFPSSNFRYNLVSHCTYLGPECKKKPPIPTSLSPLWPKRRREIPWMRCNI